MTQKGILVMIQAFVLLSEPRRQINSHKPQILSNAICWVKALGWPFYEFGTLSNVLALVTEEE